MVAMAPKCFCGSDVRIAKARWGAGNSNHAYFCCGAQTLLAEQQCSREFGFLGWTDEPGTWNQSVWRHFSLAVRHKVFGKKLPGHLAGATQIPFASRTVDGWVAPNCEAMRRRVGMNRPSASDGVTPSEADYQCSQPVEPGPQTRIHVDTSQPLTAAALAAGAVAVAAMTCLGGGPRSPERQETSAVQPDAVPTQQDTTPTPKRPADAT